MIKKVETINLDPRKTLHCNVSREAYDYTRAICLRKNITVQDLFEEICQLMITDHPHIMQIVDDLSERNFSRRVEKIKISDAESIFSLIERENPLSREKRS